MKISDIIKDLQENYSDDAELQIKRIMCLPNGNVAVFDQNDEQVGFLQGLLKTEMIEFL